MVLFFTWIWFQWVSGFFLSVQVTDVCVYICFIFIFFILRLIFPRAISVPDGTKNRKQGRLFYFTSGHEIFVHIISFAILQTMTSLKKSRREFIYKTSTIKYTCFKIIKQKYIKMQLFSRLSVFYSLDSERWTKMFGTDKNEISIILWQSTVFY